MTIDPAPVNQPGSLDALGWDAAWAETFAPFAAEGLRPARVVAVHRETSIVRDGGGRPVCRRVRCVPPRRARPRRTSRPSATGSPSMRAASIAAILPRRSVFKRMAADASRRGDRLDDEQIMASNIDVALLVAGLDNDFNLRRIERYLAVAWSSEHHARSSSSTRRTSPTTWTAGWSRSTRSPRASRSSRLGAGPAPVWTSCARHLRAGQTAAILGSSGVGKSTLVNALLGEDRQATAEVREFGLARPPHDDPPRAVRAARRRAAGRHHQSAPTEIARVVHQKPRCKIVAAVEHDVVVLDELERVRSGEPRRVPVDVRIGIDRPRMIRRALDLQAARCPASYARSAAVGSTAPRDRGRRRRSCRRRQR